MDFFASGHCFGLFRRKVQSKEPATTEDDTKLLPKQAARFSFQSSEDATLRQHLPEVQNTLLLYEPKQRYKLVKDAAIPQLKSDTEMLVRVTVVGLNPIDWKAPAYNFGLPSLPCVAGRDFAGVVIKAPKAPSRFKIGDVVASASTDYRDFRKSAFQQYNVVSDFNVYHIPSDLTPESCAPLGVAFVAATIALGICLGVNFESNSGEEAGPNLLGIIRSLSTKMIPDDIRDECSKGIEEADRPRKGDWLAIWGASSTVGYIALQLAKLAGLRVICVVDAIKHGSQLVEAGADVLVHRNNTEEAISIVQSVTRGHLRFGLDTVGKDTATMLQNSMKAGEDGNQRWSHLVGLTGLSGEKLKGIKQHKVPIKLFHTFPEIGEAITTWLEQLLLSHKLCLPEITVMEGGLDGINDALGTLREGAFDSQRIVVPI